MDAIVKQVVDALKSIRDERVEEFMKNMIPSAKTVYGVKAPFLREIIKSLRAETISFSVAEKIELALKLIKTDVHEAGQIAYEFIGKDKKLMEEISKEQLYQLNYKLDNWASVDIYSVYIFGVAWRMGKVTDDDLLELVHHNDFWLRRVAVVSTVPLNQKASGGTGDIERTFLICREVITDYEDLIVKALSWALRVLSKVEPDAVREFIEEHEEQLHRRVIREVNNKLNFGLKNLK